MEKPKGFEEYLGDYGEQIFDSWSGMPIGWGYKIVRHLGEEKWIELGKFGSFECIYPTWFLITKKLTRDEATEKYGAITGEEFGPRGGWKSVTFGEKKFISKYLK